MHIVHCLTHSNLGGGQAVPYLMIKCFQRYFPDVKHTVLLPQGGIYVTRFQQLGIETIPISFNTVSLKTISQYISILKTIKPELVHSHGRGAGLYCRLLPLKLLHVKTVHTHHGFHVPESKLKKTLFSITEKILGMHTTVTVSVSPSERTAIIEVMKSELFRIVTILNVIDVAEVTIAATQDTLPEVRSAFTATKNLFKVAIIGRDDPIKNYKLAITTAEQCLKKESGIAFFFIGCNARKDALVLQKEHKDRVFLFPMLNNPLPILKNCSALMITSRREATPLVALEAFALGKPVIGTNVRGIQDNVQNGINGFLSEENASALSLILQHVATDPVLYERLSKGAQISAGKISLENWCNQYYQLYKNLL